MPAKIASGDLLVEAPLFRGSRILRRRPDSTDPEDRFYLNAAVLFWGDETAGLNPNSLAGVAHDLIGPLRGFAALRLVSKRCSRFVNLGTLRGVAAR